MGAAASLWPTIHRNTGGDSTRVCRRERMRGPAGEEERFADSQARKKVLLTTRLEDKIRFLPTQVLHTVYTCASLWNESNFYLGENSILHVEISTPDFTRFSDVSFGRATQYASIRTGNLFGRVSACINRLAKFLHDRRCGLIQFSDDTKG